MTTLGDTPSTAEYQNKAIAAAIKTAPESVASSTALQDDDELVVPVEANTRYRFEALLVCGGSAGDIVIDFIGPAGSTELWAFGGPHSGAMFSAAQGIAIGGSNFAVQAGGILLVGATAGNLTLRWAQQTSDPAATTVQEGSSLILTKQT